MRKRIAKAIMVFEVASLLAILLFGTFSISVWAGLAGVAFCVFIVAIYAAGEQ